ncbi:MAG: ferrous iron transport protein B, partial [Chloroflexota bacterium]|nr:ferrous iron transport protein B [Chloroflexota bacterium]
MDQKMTIALLGQPNVGKSTVFNMLTGLNQHVGNWPGKTVEFKTGGLTLEETQIRLVDLPGIYSLTANSDEERIARDFIIHEQPDLAIIIVNAASLERNLYLVTEVLALDVPFVIGLNMMDVADQQGFAIDIGLLQTALGLPVVPLIASKNQGLKELIAVAKDLAQNADTFNPNRPKLSSKYYQVLKKIQVLLKGHIDSPYSSYWVALKVLEGDDEILEKLRQDHPELWSQIQPILIQHEDAILDITSSRYAWIERMVRIAILRPRHGSIVLTDRIDRFATHPFWGFILLLAVFGLVFYLTYAIASPLSEWLQIGFVQPVANLLADALINAPDWFSGLIVDGLIGGSGMVLTFVPILIIFFAALGILEDVGYLTRAAFVMDRFMHLMGLHGRSFLSFFIGFGCNVPAVMGSRIIEERRARMLTILLVPLIPCTARMAVVAFLAPAFFNEKAALITWLLVIINLSVLMLVGVTINRFVYKGEHSPFIMEIPLYHLPNIRTIGLYIWHKTSAFIKKAGGVIVVFSVIVWLFSWLPNGDLQTSYLADFGRWLEPLGRLMGLSDWRLIVALFTSFIAKENTIATLGILFGVREQSMALSTRIASSISPAGALSFLVVQMLFVPCVAVVAVIKQETASWKFTFLSVLLLLFISLSAGVGIYQCARLLGWGV